MAKGVTTFLFLLLFITSPKAGAEYRAFELKVDDTEKNKSRTIISTLDHLQYPRYHPLNKNEVIAYVDSWRCKENMMNFRQPCPKPNLPAKP